MIHQGNPVHARRAPRLRQGINSRDLRFSLLGRHEPHRHCPVRDLSLTRNDHFALSSSQFLSSGSCETGQHSRNDAFDRNLLARVGPAGETRRLPRATVCAALRGDAERKLDLPSRGSETITRAGIGNELLVVMAIVLLLLGGGIGPPVDVAARLAVFPGVVVITLLLSPDAIPEAIAYIIMLAADG